MKYCHINMVHSASMFSFHKKISMTCIHNRSSLDQRRGGKIDFNCLLLLPSKSSDVFSATEETNATTPLVPPNYLLLRFWFVNLHIWENTHKIDNLWGPISLLSPAKHQERVGEIRIETH